MNEIVIFHVSARMRWVLLTWLMLLPATAGPLTYDNPPLGTLKEPVLLRAYVPDLDLDDEVLGHHHRAAASPKYNVAKGNDEGGFFEPISGIPAAIAVNHGPALSYVFDTTECRMLYAWQGGFLDMFPDWGDKARGDRRKFDYVPRLIGTLFSKATGTHPLMIGGKALSPEIPLTYIGYDLDAAGSPTFRFNAGGHEITQRIEPLTDPPRSCRIRFTATDGTELGYRAATGEAVTHDGKTLVVTITGSVISEHHGFNRDLHITKATAKNGELVFNSYGCVTCHSVDGAPSQGPTLKGVFGSKVVIEESPSPVPADDAYLREAIVNPRAKTVKGFPPNFMPPYTLKPAELDSIILYIRSLSSK